jgi:hypothetical protein
MLSNCITHRASRRILATTSIALIVPVTALVLAAPAFAGPKGIFAIFNECTTENVEVTQCLYAKTTSGEFSVGTSKVPITKPLVLQGGLVLTEPETPEEYYLIAAKNGETLSKTELRVPVGLSGLVDCEALATPFREECTTIFEDEDTGVTATLELVASSGHFAVFNEAALREETGAALTLLTRIHLQNTFLGHSCYVGSAVSPVKLALTTGATHPPTGFTSLKGAFGKQETLTEKGETALRITGDSLVENDFSEPGAEGCGEYAGVKGFLDSTIDLKLKLPDEAGENTAIFDGELNLASSAAVIASAGF